MTYLRTAAIMVHVQDSGCVSGCISEYVHIIIIAVSFDDSVFNIWRIWQILFQSGYIIFSPLLEDPTRCLDFQIFSSLRISQKGVSLETATVAQLHEYSLSEHQLESWMLCYHSSFQMICLGK